MLCTIAGYLFLSATAVSAYHLKSGKIFADDGSEVRMKALSFFGFETQDKVVDGLWAQPLEYHFNSMAKEGFNVIRVPVSTELLLYHQDDYPYEGLVAADPMNQHTKCLDILDRFMDLAHERNMLIWLDMHRLKWDFISELWYSTTDTRFTPDNFLEAWFLLLDRYKDHPSLFIVDLLNEPHGRATWGTGDPSTDWLAFSQHAIEKIEERFPTNRWIYLVEGVGWGKDLSSAKDHPLTPCSSASQRVAYSAHSYGKSVVPSINVYDNSSLRTDWDRDFGFLMDDPNNTVIIGEWGGLTNIDHVWMNTFADYMLEKGLHAAFWSWGPNSGDVAGILLDDWTRIDDFKRQLLNRFQPNPWPVAKPVVKNTSMALLHRRLRVVRG